LLIDRDQASLSPLIGSWDEGNKFSSSRYKFFNFFFFNFKNLYFIGKPRETVFEAKAWDGGGA
jgi:hypothetical protein